MKSHLCRLVSISYAITAKGRTKVQVVWELSAKKIDDHTCEYSNHIHASATDEFLAFIEKNGVTFEQARAARQKISNSHNHEETPNFAKASNADLPVEGFICEIYVCGKLLSGWYRSSWDNSYVIYHP